ncbi:MAG: aminoacyl-tRNA hydrolase [Candidatus Falkowbacteria bacterium]
MKIIVGLGNPGTQYDRTRHNVGFKIVDTLVGEGNWRLEKKFKAYVCEKNGDLFVKPQTFMNKSGESVAAILNYYHLLPKKVGLFKTKDADLTEVLTVIHDDLDIDMGKFKLALNSSSAGHNGVQSIIDYLKTKNFKRIRVGIKNELREKMPTDKFVLGHFSEAELKNITELLPGITPQI